jgi:hypothetical protein
VSGFQGDGYAVDQSTVKYGNIIAGDAAWNAGRNADSFVYMPLGMTGAASLTTGHLEANYGWVSRRSGGIGAAGSCTLTGAALTAANCNAVGTSTERETYGGCVFVEARAEGALYPGSPEVTADACIAKADISGCEDVDDCARAKAGANGLDGEPLHYCHNNAKCQDLWHTDGISNAFECQCDSLLPKKRYTGDFCEFDVDECNGGLHNCAGDDRATCINTDGSFECTCNTGWEGDALVNIEGNDWGFGADTPATWTGCSDIDDCIVMVEVEGGQMEEQSPCLNGATCSNDEPGNGEFNCECTSGWEGELCGQDINECEIFADTACPVEFSYCHNTPGSWECRCELGYTGDPNEHCYDADDCEFSPCANGGTCTDCGTLCAICQCVAGYRGQWCSEDWNECTLGIHECHEDGHCLNTYGSYECSCLPGYSGDGYERGKCDKVDTCRIWKDKDTTCATSNKMCSTDADCDTASSERCIRVNDDDLVDYQVRAYTSELVDGEIVVTLNDQGTNLITSAIWMDDYALEDKDNKVVTQCGIYDSFANAFTKHGECEDVGQSYVCVCDDGWEDSNCDRNTDECATGAHECARYADCHDTAGSYTCRCKLGYTGNGITGCSDIDDCTWDLRDHDLMANPLAGQPPVPNLETNGVFPRCVNGKCTDLGQLNWGCQCLDGYTDSNCDQNINECDLVETDCGNNAVCEDTDGSYRCNCADGFTGDGSTCETIDDCASSPCQRGECADSGVVGYTCLCDEGWTDTRCDFDVNECEAGSHECHETGRCVNTPGGYYCRCVSGYEGDGWTCTDLDDCDPDPCCDYGVLPPPGGTYLAPSGLYETSSGCMDNGANSYTCNCRNGCNGKNCCGSASNCVEGAHNCHEYSMCVDNHCEAETEDDCGCPGRNKEPYYCAGCMANCPDKEIGCYGTKGEQCSLCTDCANWENPEYSGTYDTQVGGWKNDPAHPCVDGDFHGCIDRTDDECRDEGNEGQDRLCEDVCECCIGTENCHEWATCTNTIGSFTCECQDESFDPECRGVECIQMTTCGKNEYMVSDGTPCSDRICAPILPEETAWALEIGAGPTAQCLVLWAEKAKVFPERYNWGGRTIEVGKTATDYKDSADACPDPVCGVCDYNHKEGVENIRIGSVASWEIVNLWEDNYLIMQNSDGNGMRCLGFDKTGTGEDVQTYPQLIGHESEMVEAAKGYCSSGPRPACLDAGNCPTDSALEGFECEKDSECTAQTVMKCVKEMIPGAGSWTINGKGPADIRDRDGNLDYFCGFESDEFGTALEKLKADPQTVWNIHQLGCDIDQDFFGLPKSVGPPSTSGGPRYYCEDSKYDMKFVIRSYADKEKLTTGDEPNDSYKAQCLYFPDERGGQYTHPVRVPTEQTPDMVWGGLSFNGDATADHECGIVNGEGQTQEEALLVNNQAVFHFARLCKQGDCPSTKLRCKTPNCQNR